MFHSFTPPFQGQSVSWRKMPFHRLGRILSPLFTNELVFHRRARTFPQRQVAILLPLSRKFKIDLPENLNHQKFLSLTFEKLSSFDIFPRKYANFTEMFCFATAEPIIFPLSKKKRKTVTLLGHMFTSVTPLAFRKVKRPAKPNVEGCDV